MKFVKKGFIFNSKNQYSWSVDYGQVPRPLIMKDRIRIFYATRYFDENNMPVSQSSFIDVDRNDLSKVLYVHDKPSLQLGGNGSFSEFGIHPTMLIQKEDGLYFFYQGWQRGEEYPYATEVGLARSKDNGVTFDKVGEEPVIGKSKFDPYYVNGVFILPQGNEYIMFYSSGREWLRSEDKMESVYQIKSAISKDLINWKVNDQFIIEPNFDNECQNTATVVFFNNKYHMWFSYRKALDFRNSSNGYRIGYASSDDLKTWERNDAKAGIEVSFEESWDSQMICYPYVFELDNRLIMLYCGNYFGKTGFGYAEMELI